MKTIINNDLIEIEGAEMTAEERVLLLRLLRNTTPNDLSDKGFSLEESQVIEQWSDQLTN